MKKIICVSLCCILLLSLTACAHELSGEGEAPNKLNIICTIFPQYDWTRQILGDKAGNAEMTLLLDNGVDLHSYQPTADDIVKVSGCDLFIYVGGESDAWVGDALKEAVNKNMIVLNLMDILGEHAKEEEIVEGMQAEEEGEEAGEEPEYDEHVWLSLKNASVFCSAITEALATLDPDNAETYRANCEAYIEKLGALDAGYESAVQNAKLKTVLFADRFPFRYLADDYGLAYYAAFVGCSAETEASFETVVFLAGKVDELKLPAVLVIENSDGKIAKAVVSNASNPDTPVLAMDSMQSVTSADVAGGKTYLGIMQGNLETLRAALG